MSPYRRRRSAATDAALEQLADALEEWRTKSEELTHELVRQIAECLEAGATWGEVGTELRMTKQGARAHWGRYVEQVRREALASKAP